MLWLIRSARRGRFPLQLPTLIRAGDLRLRVVRRALRTPVRRLRRGATPVRAFLHFFAAAENARRADLGVVIFVRLIAAMIHLLSAPLPPFTPFALHTHLFPPTILVTVLRLVLRFLPLFLRTIINSLLSGYRRDLRGVLRHLLLPLRCPYLHLRTPLRPFRRFAPTLRALTLVFFMWQCLRAFLNAMLSCLGVLILCRLMTDRTHFLLYPLPLTRLCETRLRLTIVFLRLGAIFRGVSVQCQTPLILKHSPIYRNTDICITQKGI